MRNVLARRAGGYVQPDADAWFAHALATGRGHYADPAARKAAADLLPRPIPTHAALPAALANLQPGAVVSREGAWTMSTNTGGDSHGAFELQPMTDAHLTGRIVPTADQCAAGLARHATNHVRFPQARPGTSFCLRDRPTGDIVVVQVIDLDYGNWAATVTLTRYHRTSSAPGSTL